MQGKNFLTDAFEDRIDTSYETINVFSVPVYEKNQKTIKGVLLEPVDMRCLRNV